ncbi:hypothetical protein [Candidatus Nitrotoga sp. M5]|uniref:hypothetical protein n=1 Tax=Candidatus Nitrotoga sp. M5 TaxID=2890409 RepID=UPI001EF6B3E0|nr:hypothetical protein [Candidatus Nitrotoga sp. M5]CAH1387193.1 conserved exported hypothetical protein [Candidatus Nitrotoga sp. M5]
MYIIGLIFASLLILSSGAQAKPTHQCNTRASNQLFVSGDGTGELAKSRILAAVTSPESDINLYTRLWEPTKATPYTFVWLQSWMVVLFMDPLQDLTEMIDAIRADPLVASLGVSYVGDNSSVCFATSAPAQAQSVTEYHNTLLNHYFLSSTIEENAFIDSGGAGPGWVRTGESFLTFVPDGCFGSVNVFRFYGPGPNSHFYTADTKECGGLRNQESGWNAEGIAFGGILPEDGQCPNNGGYVPPIYTPLYRLYNNRWMFNDSNHRYTVRYDIYEQMMNKGWVGEGVALCVRNER